MSQAGSVGTPVRELPLIVHLIPTLGSGGAEALLATNLQNFDRARFRHVVVVILEERCALNPGTHFWEEAIAASGVEVHRLGVRDRRGVSMGVARLAAWLRARRASVVHTHLMLANLMGSVAGRLSRTRVVRSLHSVSYEPEVLAGYANPSSPKHEVARRVEAFSAAHGVDRVVAVGETVARSAARRLAIPPARIRVIYNPVRLATPTPGARETIRARLGIAADAPLVVSVGRVIPSKAHALLVRAMVQVHAVVPDAHLAVVGALGHPVGEPALRAMIAACDAGASTSLVGAQRDVADWLAAADVFAFPSRFEGLSVALAEAAMAGCACVASDIGGNREIIDGRDRGLLVPVDDVAGWSTALSQLLLRKERREEIGRAAQRFARERFDPLRSARALESLYRDMLALP